RTIISLGKIFRKHNIQVCIVGNSHLLSIALLARKVFSPATSIIFTQMMQSGLPKKDWFHNWIYRSLDAAIVMTKKMKAELEATTVMDPKKIVALAPGIKYQKFHRSKEEQYRDREYFQVPQDAFVIGCIGRLDKHKDQLLLLEAFAESGLHANCLLVLCGDETPDSFGYAQKLREYVAAHELKEVVRFMSFTDSVERLFSCFDMFVMPSRSETFGLVVVEAMAAGIPVIATNSGGVPEIIEDGQTGLLFDPRDKKKLIELLRKLFESKELRASLATEALNVVRERFDYERQTRRFFGSCEATIPSSIPL
ncbi:MAG TPA: glycosyltransferase family 4 protein, partial [Candidatus Kapabacteria bacterium]|nr:glycosyltransferase family 4 protein [Candidatus Kapabacteria bacterium]